MSLFNNESQLKKIIGITHDDILILADRLYSLEVLTTMSTVSLTLLLLFHLRQYTSSEVTSWIFEIPLSTFGNIIWKLISPLYKFYATRITFPPLEDRLSQAINFFRYFVTWVGDGMEQECIMKVNKNDAKQMRSGKKQKYTITKFLFKEFLWIFQ